MRRRWSPTTSRPATSWGLIAGRTHSFLLWPGRTAFQWRMKATTGSAGTKFPSASAGSISLRLTIGGYGALWLRILLVFAPDRGAQCLMTNDFASSFTPMYRRIVASHLFNLDLAIPGQ